MKRRNEFIIIILSLLLGVLFIRFGSSMDYLTQHIIFPDYLREMFYKSGKIIPSFMTHIGAGENVFNISYYGLLNPIILISYLLPFVKMLDYIVVTNIILFTVSSLLFYKFVGKFKNPLFLTLLFMLSGPIVFQFHRHFMFVNYMPFLILAFINIDKKKYLRFIIDLFFIIMISFYYSIPSILGIIIYYVYVNFEKFDFKRFLKFIGYICISILMSSILLIPTLCSILSTRSGGLGIDFSLLIPNINLDNILYGGYSVGLTSICFISFIYLLFSKKKNNLFLFISLGVICFIPLILYLLNGGLYVRAKVLIPFLPIFIYIIGLFVDSLDEKFNFFEFLIFVLFINFIVILRYRVLIYYVDLVFVLLLLFLYKRFGKKLIIYIPIVCLSLVTCVVYNMSESHFSRDYYNSLNDKYISTTYRISSLNNDSINISNGNLISSIYSSTINRNYSNLYHDLFKINNSTINGMSLNGTSNPLFNRYMGVKYLYSDYELGFPYSKVSNDLYELDVLPIGYVNSKCVNKEYFDSLEYPFYLDILSNYVVLDECSNKPVSKISQVELDYDYVLGSNSHISNGKLYVDSNDVIKVNISDDLNGKLLFIDILGQEEQNDNISMTINGMTNLLTKRGWLYPNNNNDFNFIVSGNELEVKVSKGIYNVSDIKTYVMDYKFDMDYDSFNISIIDSEKISGDIEVNKGGYFILSIPYDNGFNIMANGNKVNYSNINGLIGFYLDKGNYNININYVSPGLGIGKVFSMVGACLFIGVCILERRNKNED